MSVRIVRVDQTRDPAVLAGVAALEGLASYPLGDDRFQVDHGPDYLAFFQRMGDLLYLAAVDGEQVVAVGAGVLRTIPYADGEAPRRAWYLCDLKVHPEHRGRRIPLQLLRAGFCPHVLRCHRGYAISMDPPAGENRVVRLLGRWRWTPIRFARRLHLFSLDSEQMRAAAPAVEAERGPLGYLSLRGVKDIVLESTGQPMPLLHVVWGAAREAAAAAAPQPEHTHMLCAPEDDPLDRALRAAGHQPSAKASVVAHRMADCDWRFVLTSEI
ncbi:MAG: hypothetical protein AB7N76_20150 [Planctomycetota bacterium]